MCEFISWIEYKDNIYFMDDTKLNTKEGRELIKYLGNQYADDIKGHGAIRHYYPEIKDKGVNKECADFSSPNNFPPEIVEAIKRGIFAKVGKPGSYILTGPALAEYERIKGQAWAEYKRIKGQASAEYGRITRQALAEYDRIKGQALAEYGRITRQACWKLVRNPVNRAEAWK